MARFSLYRRLSPFSFSGVAFLLHVPYSLYASLVDYVGAGVCSGALDHGRLPPVVLPFDL